MATLVLHSVAYWLATIDTRRMGKDDPRRVEILAYQREAVDALYAWASTPKAIAAPAHLVPAEPITQPARPAPDATTEEWIIYHQQMLTVLEWQRDIEHWRGNVESRLEGLEAIIPDILEKLPPQSLTPTQQQHVRTYVKVLSEKTGKPYATIWEEFKMVFEVARYQDTPQEDWDKVVNWFQVQIERARGKR